MDSLISVIVPVYNVERYLNECVESILNQTYKNIEIILVDDGSTDSSGKICEIYKQKSPQISVVHTANNGIAAARNVGIGLANGEYITFIDSDDVISPDMIRVLYDNIDECDMSMCANFKFREKLPEENSKGRKYFIQKKEYFKRLLENPDYVVAWGKLYKRDMIKDTLFLEGIIHEDEEYMPRIMVKMKRICVDSRKLYYYRIRPNSIMTSAFQPKKLDIIIASQRRIEILKNLGYKALYRKAVIDYYIHLQKLLTITGSPLYEKEHALIMQKIQEWAAYNVKITFLERVRFGISKEK